MMSIVRRAVIVALAAVTPMAPGAAYADTLRAAIAAAAGGDPVPSHHSPLFRIDPQPAVTPGVEATVVGLLELMGR